MSEYFFIPNEEKWRKGYYIPVRNRFNNKIEKEFIEAGLKSMYENSFGKTIIYNDEFLDWYSAVKKEETDERIKRFHESTAENES